MYNVENRCNYWGEDIAEEDRSPWFRGWGRCNAEATVFIDGKGFCERHAVVKPKGKHRKNTRARVTPIIPDVEDQFVDKPLDRW